MWTVLTLTLSMLAAYIATRLSARRYKNLANQETYARQERRQKYLALEHKYLYEGVEKSSTEEIPDTALRSLGNLAYLVWLLNYEPQFRNFCAEGGVLYPPDWEWRRKFIFLRDHGICQRCKKSTKEGISLDCHHIKPISEFGSAEPGRHSLSNLISLCPQCHAIQHQGNSMLFNRANRMLAHNQPNTFHSGKQSIKQKTTPEIYTLRSPIEFEVQPSPEHMQKYILGSVANDDSRQIINTNSNPEIKSSSDTRSIRNGLALIDERLSEIARKESIQHYIDEDIYGNCDFCDAEILINPYLISERGKFLCDDCYSTGGRKD